ncbi:rod shape-determining protein RodA [Streptomyces orinoci]|uniref:peptidoglycan glycosyltransferase n=1 Tax=Streptomyces orinoci TaxID=67339 RepID=A0ABV3JQW6_STRON|nr:rod shape-determining protein RodA [Streptomyces orinoci]
MSAAGSLPLRRFAPPRSTWSRLTGRDGALRRLDWPMLLAALALSVLGCLLVYSATRGRTGLTHGDPYYFLKRNILNTVIGLALAAGAVRAGHRALRGAVPVLYILSVLATAAVLTPLGATINGARSWIQLGGGFSVQPSEFTKITITLGMAVLLARQVDSGERSRPGHRAVLQALGVAAVPVLVILLMPDLGSVMVLAVIVLAVLLASGAARRWILGLLSGGVLGCVLIWQLGILDTYQINRFAAFANPAFDPSGIGYNTMQARIAIGSGGLTGAGLFHGPQTTGRFVPEQQTDFVFTVAGEELGFLGAGAIILLLGVVLWRACRIAREATDRYGAMVAAGVITWFAFQSFENIGMTLGIMPVTGLPLPFVSYGGSSAFAAWTALGLLQAVKARRPLAPA